ncbi:MAG: hypothetical protein JW932_17355 [Deltaproteobacteria bacterium]|nr:hypothetical protein [Deltaproteobacteria bacterium]
MRNRRTIITISESEKSWLAAYSKNNHISMAEAIRRSIAQLKEQEVEGVYQKLVHETKGIWDKGDGLKYQNKIRSEWD